MKNKMRKATQRELTSFLRTANKLLEKDNLWRGRFVVRQIMSDWEQFDDNSGGLLWSVIRVYDKKTGDYRDYTLESLKGLHFTFSHLMCQIINKFITEDSDTWYIEDPYKDKTDYNKIKVDNKRLQYDKKRGFSFYGISKL